MSSTKDELRAEIAGLREELAAERAKVEVLREKHAAHSCFGHVTWFPTAGAAPYVPPVIYPPYVTCGSETTGGWSTSDVTTVTAAGCAGGGSSTYTLC